MGKNKHISSYSTPDGRRYRVYFVLNGVRFRKSGLISRKEAEILYVSVRSKILSGDWNDRCNVLESYKNIKLSQALKMYWKKISNSNQYRLGSLTSKKVHLNTLEKILGPKTMLKTLSDYKVKQKLSSYQINKELSVSYLNTLTGCWNKFVEFGQEFGLHDHLETLPWTKTYHNLKEDRFLTRDELEEFFSVFDPKPHNQYWRRYFKLLFLLALRVNECSALRWDDVCFRTKTILIQRTLVKTTKYKKVTNPVKNDKVTRLPLSQEAYNILMEQKYFLETYTCKGKFLYRGNVLVFPSRGSKTYLDYCSVRNALQRYKGKTGITHRIRTHDFRRSFTQLALEAGVGVRFLSQYTRHEPETLLKCYSIVRSHYFMEHFANFDPLNSTKEYIFQPEANSSHTLEAEIEINSEDLERPLLKF